MSQEAAGGVGGGRGTETAVWGPGGHHEPRFHHDCWRLAHGSGIQRQNMQPALRWAPAAPPGWDGRAAGGTPAQLSEPQVPQETGLAVQGSVGELGCPGAAEPSRMAVTSKKGAGEGPRGPRPLPIQCRKQETTTKENERLPPPCRAEPRSPAGTSQGRGRGGGTVDAKGTGTALPPVRLAASGRRCRVPHRLPGGGRGFPTVPPGTRDPRRYQAQAEGAAMLPSCLPGSNHQATTPPTSEPGPRTTQGPLLPMAAAGAGPRPGEHRPLATTIGGVMSTAVPAPPQGWGGQAGEEAGREAAEHCVWGLFTVHAVQ